MVIWDLTENTQIIEQPGTNTVSRVRAHGLSLTKKGHNMAQPTLLDRSFAAVLQDHLQAKWDPTVATSLDPIPGIQWLKD
jgi:hypothetical protein